MKTKRIGTSICFEPSLPIISLHETTKFTPFFLNFGHSQSLPVDIMLGREPQERICKICHSMCSSCNSHCGMLLPWSAITLISVTDSQRSVSMVGLHMQRPEDLRIGDRVWLFVLAVKTGRTEKLASLWRGPYTVIDKLSPVNYRIQLIGTTKSLVVHRNRLLWKPKPKGSTSQETFPALHYRPKSPCTDCTSSTTEC